MASESVPSKRPVGPIGRVRRAGVDAVDAVARQGLKYPLMGPRQLARRAFGRHDLAKVVGGRTVVVTGASSGIGEATAMRFAAAGADVVLVARRADELQRVADAIIARGGSATPRVCDLAKREAIEDLVGVLLAEHDPVEIVINNAGRSIRRSIHESFDRFHDFERTMALNYFGPVALTLGVLPGMIERGSGQIINISTWGTQLPSPKYVAYASSKAALDAFSRGTDAELLGTGVTLSTVHLPLVRTPMITPALDAYKGMPSLSADEAAGLIAEAAITRSPRVEPAFVTLGHLGDAVSARGTGLVMGTMQRAGVGPVTSKR